MRSSIFEGNTSAQKVFNDHWNEEDDEDDDHMESSRVLSPGSRFQPRSSVGRTSTYTNGYGSKTPPPLNSLSDKLKGAWGYFSRPLGTNTPCAKNEMDYKTTPASLYTTHTSKYGRYSSDRSDIWRPKRDSISPIKKSITSYSAFDVSGGILVALSAFVVVLGGAYLWFSNPQAVEQTAVAVKEGIHNTLNFFYKYAVLPTATVAIVLILATLAYQLYRRYTGAQRAHKLKVMALVERITDVIRDAGEEGIAEPHVRDLLMPPTKRSKEDWSLWTEAAAFINAEDSRVCTEVRLVNGVECSIWLWVPVSQQQQKWQGTAVAGSGLPSRALTRCIKLRGLNFSNRAAEKSELQQELLGKLAPTKPIHVNFSAGPPESIVYMMFRNLDDAKKAFFAFSSHWYNGSLITAKYVRDERYAERFPEMAGK